MTDYYAVLRKAVGGLENGPGDARRAVYDKARNALVGQLKSIDPPLTTSEISRQRLELEEAIRKVERESTVTTVGPAPARVRATAAVAEALAAEPADQDYSRYIEDEISQPPPPPRPVQRAPEPPRPASSTSYPSNNPYRPPQLERQPSPQPPNQQWPQVSAAPAVAWPQQSPPPRDYQAPRREPARYEPEPMVDHGLSVSPGNYAPEPEWGAEPYRGAPAVDNSFDDPQRGRRAVRGNQDRNQPYVERRGSRWPTIILILVIVLILAGIGAMTWSQRRMVKDVVGDLISSLDQGGGKPTLSEKPAETPAPEATSSKNSDRLGGGSAGSDDVPKPVRTVDAKPSEGSEPDPLSAAPAPTPPPAQVETAPTAPAPAPPPAPAPADDAAAPAAPPADDSLVAQKALLYEQPADANQAVKVVDAVVTWKFDANSSNGPQIQAKLDIPERSMKVTMNIRKNTDSGLPASHLVEVIVDTPANFPGGSIKSVPAFIMKPTEQSRGQPLDGAAAKVADGFFWIAFSNDPSMMARNIESMKTMEWIDIPLVYGNDKKAILTFQKGTPGDRVFDKAIAAWGN